MTAKPNDSEANDSEANDVKQMTAKLNTVKQMANSKTQCMNAYI